MLFPDLQLRWTAAVIPLSDEKLMLILINNLPATDAYLKEIQSQQIEDPVCQKLKTYVTGPAKIDYVSANYTELYFR